MEAITSAVIDLAEKYLGEFRIKNGEIICKRCPFCHGGSHDDYETFAVNMSSGLWNCRRGSCSKKQGNFKELCDFFGETHYDIENYTQITKLNATKKKNFVKPSEDEFHEVTDDIITYFGRRMISEQTVRDWKIMSDDKGNIVFPFYWNNQLTYVKYRQPRPWGEVKKEYEEKLKTLPKEQSAKLRKPAKEWIMPNTQEILFGMDMVSYNRPLVICEGQIDAMSLYEAGVTNVVSVPAGVDHLEWINTCWEWLDNFAQIILFGDSDEPGVEMVQMLMKRLGEDRCMIAKEYPELIYQGKDYGRQCKDANEILRCYGPEGLKQAVDACVPAPVKGILNLANVQFVDPASKPKILTKIPALDFAIGGLMEGGVTIFSGKRGEGKLVLSLNMVNL